MMDDMKSKYLEKKFDEYNDGVAAPEIDLTAAKAAVRAKRRRRAPIFAAAAALSACLLVGVFLLPFALRDAAGGNSAQDPDAESPALYSLSETVAAPCSYAALSKAYPDYARPFARLSLSANAWAEYSLLEWEGASVALRVDFAFLGGLSQAKGTLWLDLSGGKMDAKEFSEYGGLAGYYRGARYETEYENAEYLSKAETFLQGAVCRIDLCGNRSDILFEFLSGIL